MIQEIRNLAIKKADRYTIVSNLDEWTAFFKELIALIKSGELRFPKGESVDMQLVNTASTKSNSGQPFFYFKAVDTGRKSIKAKGGKHLFFTVGRKSPLYVKDSQVGPAAGFQITAKSLAQIQATFSNDVTERFREWLNNATLKSTATRNAKGQFTASPLKHLGNFKTTPTRKNGKSVPLLDKAVPRRARLTQAQRTQVNDTKKNEFNRIKLELMGKGFKSAQAIRLATSRARVAANKEEIKLRSAYAKAGLKGGANAFKFLKKGGVDIQAAKSKFFDVLTRVPNKDALLAIFMDIIEKQIGIFQSNTPTLSQFKLLSDGSVLSPEQGGELRDSYQVVSNKDLKNI